MPEYLRPGVYIEEQPAPQTIEGVSTSTAGFVGATQFGPIVGLPQLVTSFSDFTRKYGDFIPVHDEDDWGEDWEGHQYLAHAVDGFFRNGGQRAYVMRVVGPGAEPAPGWGTFPGITTMAPTGSPLPTAMRRFIVGWTPGQRFPGGKTSLVRSTYLLRIIPTLPGCRRGQRDGFNSFDSKKTNEE
jgi:hypothetical protein